MNNCPKCGAALSADAKACATCGSLVEEMPAQSASTPARQGMSQEPPKRRLGMIIAVVVALLVILFAITRCGGEKAKSPDEARAGWDASIAAEVLPYPEKGKVDVWLDDGESASVHVNEFSEQEYAAYVEACKEKGFTVEPDDSLGYEAFNVDGYKVSLSFYGSSEKMDISLVAPKDFATIKWPTSEIASLLPKPKSTVGKIEWEKSSGFCIYVAETPPGDYATYVEECAAKGFAVDYDKGEKFYSADNEAGYHLRLEYCGFSVMLVKLEAPDDTAAPKKAEEAEPVAAEPPSAPVSEPAPGGGLDPVFKESMDSYEEFMDGYIAFMESYNSSDDLLGMATDYARWMTDYADVMSKIDAIDESSLGAEELAYYTEVTTRVSEKLLAAAV